MTDTPLQANRELDAEIAVKIFGWRWFVRPFDGKCFIVSPGNVGAWEAEMAVKDVTGRQGEYQRAAGWDRADCLPAYSSDPAAMDLLVKELMHDWGVVKTVSSDAPYFECEIVARDGSAAFVGASETSLGEATCRAALSAVAQEVKS